MLKPATVSKTTLTRGELGTIGTTCTKPDFVSRSSKVSIGILASGLLLLHAPFATFRLVDMSSSFGGIVIRNKSTFVRFATG